MMKLYKYILKHYGDLENEELCDIFSDTWNYLMQGQGDANSIKQRFAKWEKRHAEAGL